jgi:hypothetical protein
MGTATLATHILTADFLGSKLALNINSYIQIYSVSYQKVNMAVRTAQLARTEIHTQNNTQLVWKQQN